MRRKEFLRKLKEELRKRRDIEVEEVLFYYDEMIQDAVDNGESEEVFIMNLGSVESIRKKIEDQEDFIVKVKTRNKIVVDDVLSNTVKIVGYVIFAIIAFSLTVASFSVFVSGIAVIFTAIVRLFVSTPGDVYGYLAMLGVVMVGVSLSLLSYAVVRWLYTQSKPALLNIFRRIQELIHRREN